MEPAGRHGRCGQRTAAGEPAVLGHEKGPDLPGAVPLPAGYQIRPRLALTVDPDQCREELPKEDSLTVVDSHGRVGQVNRVGQRDGEGVDRIRSGCGQPAGVSGVGNWRSRRCSGASGQWQQDADDDGEPYNSATTNGLPPSLALMSGRAAMASAFVGYSPTLTL